jgi:hypothetical protein
VKGMLNLPRDDFSNINVLALVNSGCTDRYPSMLSCIQRTPKSVNRSLEKLVLLPLNPLCPGVCDFSLHHVLP